MHWILPKVGIAFITRSYVIFKWCNVCRFDAETNVLLSGLADPCENAMTRIAMLFPLSVIKQT